MRRTQPVKHQRVGATAEAESAPNDETSQLGLPIVDGGPRARQLKACVGTIETPLGFMKRDRHEGVLEVKNQGEDLLVLAEVVAEECEIQPVVDAARKHLAFRQGYSAIHSVGAEILDEPVLKGAVLLQLDHVAERSWVALAAQVSLRISGVVEKHGEAIIDLGFRQVPRGGASARGGRVGGRGSSGDLVERGVVRGNRRPLVQDGHRVSLVHLYSGEVRPNDDGTSQPHRSARTQPNPYGCVGVRGPIEDRADQLGPPRAGRVMLVKDTWGYLEQALELVADSQDGSLERRGPRRL